MTKKEINALINHNSVPTPVREQVIKKVGEIIAMDKTPEVVLSRSSVTVDAYDESGREVVLKIKLAK